MDPQWKRDSPPHQRSTLGVAVPGTRLPPPPQDALLEREEQAAAAGADAGQSLHHHPDAVLRDLRHRRRPGRGLGVQQPVLGGPQVQLDHDDRPQRQHDRRGPLL